MRQTYDVCVFGAGPAGAATAPRLADLGVAPIVLDRPPKQKPWGGESLTGAIRQPLGILGLWQGFCAAGPAAGASGAQHRSSFIRTVSAWSSRVCAVSTE